MPPITQTAFMQISRSINSVGDSFFKRTYLYKNNGRRTRLPLFCLEEKCVTHCPFEGPRDTSAGRIPLRLCFRQRLGRIAGGLLSGQQEQDISGRRQKTDGEVQRSEQTVCKPVLKAQNETADNCGKRRRRYNDRRPVRPPENVPPRQIGREQERNAQ